MKKDWSSSSKKELKGASMLLKHVRPNERRALGRFEDLGIKNNMGSITYRERARERERERERGKKMIY